MKENDEKLLVDLFDLFKAAEKRIGALGVNASNGVQITRDKFKEFFHGTEVFDTSVLNGVSYNHYQVTVGGIRLCSCEEVAK